MKALGKAATKSSDKSRIYGAGAKASVVPKTQGKATTSVQSDEQLAEQLVQRSWKYMYKLPPTGDITLEEFETFAYNRLQLLTKIDIWRAKGLKPQELNAEINRESLTLLGKPETEKKDWISHHILRLAYSQDENLRRWFLQNELSLFEARLNQEDPNEYRKILEYNNLSVEQVSADELTDHKEELRKVARYIYEDEQVDRSKRSEADFAARFAQYMWFKVDFQQVLNLVSRRRVYLRQGKAYVTTRNLTTLILQSYRSKLAEQLAYINRVWPFIKENEKDRLLPLLTRFAERTTIKGEYSDHLSTKDRAVTAEQIDDLSKQSFPLCMKTLHAALKKNNHLKHQGRQQYGLFLKGIGLSLEEALRFWQDHFSKSKSPDEFNKNYAYNIRHNYGKEGKRTNYSPYGCQKIITGSAPGVGEYHGCPFKHFEERSLRETIVRESQGKVEARQVDELILLVRNQHYPIACRKFFELTHPEIPNEISDSDDGTPFQHPNRYYDFSRRVLEYEGPVSFATGGSQPQQPLQQQNPSMPPTKFPPMPPTNFPPMPPTKQFPPMPPVRPLAAMPTPVPAQASTQPQAAPVPVSSPVAPSEEKDASLDVPTPDDVMDESDE